jgi:transketolase
METFGESGPAPAVYEHFGITAQHAAELGRAAMERAVVGSASDR